MPQQAHKPKAKKAPKPDKPEDPTSACRLTVQLVPELLMTLQAPKLSDLQV